MKKLSRAFLAASLALAVGGAAALPCFAEPKASCCQGTCPMESQPGTGTSCCEAPAQSSAVSDATFQLSPVWAVLPSPVAPAAVEAVAAAAGQKAVPRSAALVVHSGLSPPVA